MGGIKIFGVLAKNRGTWGCESFCKGEDGNTLKYSTREEAQTVADEYNSQRRPVNNFTQYFAAPPQEQEEATI